MPQSCNLELEGKPAHFSLRFENDKGEGVKCGNKT